MVLIHFRDYQPKIYTVERKYMLWEINALRHTV